MDKLNSPQKKYQKGYLSHETKIGLIKKYAGYCRYCPNIATKKVIHQLEDCVFVERFCDNHGNGYK